MQKYLSIIFIAVATSGMAQRMVLSTGLEKTVNNLEASFSTGYQTKKHWSLGAFYQQAVEMPAFESTSEGDRLTWYGVYANLPLAAAEKISCYAQVRTGMTTDGFVQVVPSLETKLKISKWAAVSFGTSYRQGYAAFLLKTHIQFINK